MHIRLVDGQYVRGYSFEAGALGKNQTFTIPYADLFKAYCFDREFKKLIDSGQFVFTDRHLVLNNEKYIARNQAGNATLSEYALTHMDECCVVFSKGGIAINRNIKGGEVLHAVHAERRSC